MRAYVSPNKRGMVLPRQHSRRIGGPFAASLSRALSKNVVDRTRRRARARSRKKRAHAVVGAVM